MDREVYQADRLADEFLAVTQHQPTAVVVLALLTAAARRLSKNERLPKSGVAYVLRRSVDRLMGTPRPEIQ